MKHDNQKKLVAIGLITYGLVSFGLLMLDKHLPAWVIPSFFAVGIPVMIFITRGFKPEASHENN